jgi:SAM-dependent methyltransferase
MLLALARASKFREVHGLDIAQPVVARAGRTCERMLGSLNGVILHQADLNEELPYGDACFDAVSAVAVLEHIFDPYFSVGEIRRVLRIGGQLVLEVPNLAWLPRRVDVVLGHLPITGDEEGWDGGHLHYFTFATVRRLLEQYRFSIEYMGSTGIFPRLRNLWPTLLGGNVFVVARKLDA